MVVSAKEEKEKKLTILDVLFTENVSSVYELSQLTKIPQPTVKRYIPQLKKNGLVIIDKKETGRKTIQPTITKKGYLYLIFYKELTDEKLVKALNKYFGELKAPSNVYSMGYETYRNVFNIIKSRINFDYYDQQYVDEMLDELILIETLKLKTQKAVNTRQDNQAESLINHNREGMKQLLKQYKKYEEKHKMLYDALKQINKGIEYQLRARG